MELLEHGGAVIEIIAIAASAVSVYVAIRTDLVMLRAKDAAQDFLIAEVKADARATEKKISEHLETHPACRRVTDCKEV
jgi:AmiR/NasT family two-component response regulator